MVETNTFPLQLSPSATVYYSPAPLPTDSPSARSRRQSGSTLGRMDAAAEVVVVMAKHRTEKKKKKDPGTRAVESPTGLRPPAPDTTESKPHTPPTPVWWTWWSEGSWGGAAQSPALRQKKTELLPLWRRRPVTTRARTVEKWEKEKKRPGRHEAQRSDRPSSVSMHQWVRLLDAVRTVVAAVIMVVAAVMMMMSKRKRQMAGQSSTITQIAGMVYYWTLRFLSMARSTPLGIEEENEHCERLPGVKWGFGSGSIRSPLHSFWTTFYTVGPPV